MKYKIDDNTIWEDTGKIVIHNYPPSNMTYSYVTRLYREIKRDSFGWKEVEGNPIYFHDMKTEQMVLCKIIGDAQNALVHLLPKEKLKLMKDDEF